MDQSILQLDLDKIISLLAHSVPPSKVAEATGASSEQMLFLLKDEEFLNRVRAHKILVEEEKKEKNNIDYSYAKAEELALKQAIDNLAVSDVKETLAFLRIVSDRNQRNKSNKIAEEAAKRNTLAGVAPTVVLAMPMFLENRTIPKLTLSSSNEIISIQDQSGEEASLQPMPASKIPELLLGKTIQESDEDNLLAAM